MDRGLPRGSAVLFASILALVASTLGAAPAIAEDAELGVDNKIGNGIVTGAVAPVEPPLIPVDAGTDRCPVMATQTLERHLGQFPGTWVERVRVPSDGSVIGTPVRCRFDIGPAGSGRTIVIEIWPGRERYAAERAAAEEFASRAPSRDDPTAWPEHAFLIDGAGSSSGTWDACDVVEAWAELPAQTLRVRLAKGLEELVDPELPEDYQLVLRTTDEIAAAVAFGPGGSGWLGAIGPSYCHLLSQQELGDLTGVTWRDNSSGARGVPASRLPGVTNDDPLTPCEFNVDGFTERYDVQDLGMPVGDLAMGVTSRENAAGPREFAEYIGAEVWDVPSLGEGSYMVLEESPGPPPDIYRLVVPFDEYAFIGQYWLTEEFASQHGAMADVPSILQEVAAKALARAPQLLQDAGFSFVGAE